MYIAVRYFVTAHCVLYPSPIYIYMCFFSPPFDLRTKVVVKVSHANLNEVNKVVLIFMQVDKMLKFGHKSVSFEQCYFLVCLCVLYFGDSSLSIGFLLKAVKYSNAISHEISDSFEKLLFL